MRDGDVFELHVGDVIQGRREARLRCGFRPHLDADGMRAGFRYGNESQIINQVSQKIEVRERAVQKAAQSRRPSVPTATMVIHNDSLHDGSPRISGLEPARVLIPKLARACELRSQKAPATLWFLFLI